MNQTTEKTNRLRDFSALRISVASPDKIMNWSFGEVVKPETINYRTFRPEKDGLFDERIFGPTKDFECYCGKYKRIRFKGVVCDKCGVEVTRKAVRRERMGHIKLSAPVAHAWYFRGVPSKLGLLLDISPRLLESVIYFSRFMVVSVDYADRAKVIGNLEREEDEKLKALKAQYDSLEKEEKTAAKTQLTDMKIKGKDQKQLIEEEVQLRSRKKLIELNEKYLAQVSEIQLASKELIGKLEKVEERLVLSEEEYFTYYEYLEQFANVTMGAEAVRDVLKEIDLAAMSKDLRSELTGSSGQKRIKIIKRLGVVEALRAGSVRPEWLILTTLPVIPPDLRPMVQLEGGRFATSDLNDLYRAVINRNNRLKRLLDMGAPEIIVRNEKRMLQEAVDALIDSGKVQRYRVRRGKQPLKSLTDMLKGKQGRFRQNLLGKRVDYSGRSVIVAGPTMRMYETGLPKEMALELFKPFVIRELLLEGHAPNPKSARYYLEGRTREVWDALERVVKNYPVLLNRAPTLHRLGIVAFYPKLIEGNAIQLHPCVCAGFNADFDGDQMSVHVPISHMAKHEATELMLSSKNLLKPADGEPIAIPTKEMALGTFYLTSVDEEMPMFSSILADEQDALRAYELGSVKLRQLVRVRLNSEIIETTVGRIIFNQVLPESLRFHNEIVEKKGIKKLINASMTRESEDTTVDLIDSIKDLGFKYSTKSGVSVSIFDNVVSVKRPEVLKDAEKKAIEISNNFKRGLITKREKSSLLQGIWTKATHDLDIITWEELEETNDVKIIVNAGASRATREQVKQLGGMKGLVYDLTGNIAELPIKSNFRGGLSGIEYFTGARAARKSLADTALKTADSGYLTRKLVDVAQELLIVGEDCGASIAIPIERKQKVALASYGDRVYGRVVAKDIKIDGKTLVKKGGLITREIADQIDTSDLTVIEIRSPLTCENNVGICRKCYGLDVASRLMAEIGSPIGVIAAQSIGEPGTQLTLRTFHTGGIVGKDITQGLPRITEIFEARTPKFKAIMSEVSGKVEVKHEGDDITVVVTPTNGKNAEPVSYAIPKALDVSVTDGDLVSAGSKLTEGNLDPKTLIKEVGIHETQRHLVEEVQYVYTSQGVTVNDKHVEVIVRQMFSRLQIDEVGDSAFFPGDVISVAEWEDSLQEMKKLKKQAPTAKKVVLGVTRAALKTDSFLAAASFQETSRVLTEAAMSGKVDRLRGLKENVIIGRRIPVGNRVDYTEDFAKEMEFRPDAEAFAKELAKAESK